MEQLTGVFVVVMHFSVTVFGQTFQGRVIPDGSVYQRVYVSESDCKRTIPALERAFAGKTVAPRKIVCEKMELRK